MSVADACGLGAFYEQRQVDSVHITAAASVPVSSDFQPIGFPPIHNHHSQLIVSDTKDPVVDDPIFKQNGAAPMTEMLLLNHQDSTCAVSDLSCNIKSFPKGASASISEKLVYGGMFNDVRPAGSPPAAFYVDVGIAVAAEPTAHAVVQVRLGSIAYGMGYLPQITFMTIPIPASLPASVYWVTWKVAFSGRALNIWLHTHAGFGYRATWVVGGSADALGLKELPWVQGSIWSHECSLQRVPAVPMEAIKTSILDAIQQKGLAMRSCMGARPASYTRGMATCSPTGRASKGPTDSSRAIR